MIDASQRKFTGIWCPVYTRRTQSIVLPLRILSSCCGWFGWSDRRHRQLPRADVIQHDVARGLEKPRNVQYTGRALNDCRRTFVPFVSFEHYNVRQRVPAHVVPLLSLSLSTFSVSFSLSFLWRAYEAFVRACITVRVHGRGVRTTLCHPRALSTGLSVVPFYQLLLSRPFSVAILH